MNNSLQILDRKLPDKIENVAAFAIYSQEKLKSIKAEISAIKRLGLAQEVWEQKTKEAQEVAELATDAFVAIGKFANTVPKASGGDRRSESFKSSPEGTFEKGKIETLSEMGLSKKQISQAQILAKNPIIVEQAKAEARENDDIVSRSFVLEKIKAVEREKREQRREDERIGNAEKVATLGNPLEAQGLFQTIVIDPPWDWGDEGDINQMGRAKPDYATMPIAEIEALPINKIADENCHLYLWVTNRSLPKAFRLIEAWGFRYITCITWVKPSFGMGNYFRGSTEQVLFAVKGSQALKRKDAGTHFAAPRGNGHSAKPDAFYGLVRSCSHAPYIDIFGRKERDGWTVWGETGDS